MRLGTASAPSRVPSDYNSQGCYSEHDRLVTFGMHVPWALVTFKGETYLINGTMLTCNGATLRYYLKKEIFHLVLAR